MTQTYRLSIFDITHNQTHTINFPGTKTLLEVKRDVSDLTSIPVRNQSWNGWPPLVTDDVGLRRKILSVNFLIPYIICKADTRSLWNQLSA